MIGAKGSGLLAHPAWAAFDTATVPADADLKVARVIPEGDAVPGPGREIVVTFDRPMVAIGVMTAGPDKVPVSISPQLDCQWHWLDPRSLACELNAAQALSPATRYTVTVAPGLMAQDGARRSPGTPVVPSGVQPAGHPRQRRIGPALR
jgi:hypothetical protein